MSLAFGLWISVATLAGVATRGSIADICDEFKVSGGPGSEMGYAVDLDGHFAAIGAPEFFGFGSVHVYRRTGSGWNVQAFIEPQQSQYNDQFGHSVGIQGTDLIVGAPEREVDGFEGAGVVFVFVRQANGEWVERQQILPSDLEEGAAFGHSVAIAGDTLAIGAQGQFGVLGKVHVYRKADDEWIASQILSTGEDDWFGTSIAIDADRMAVGAAGEDELTGAAYIYEFDGASWVQVDRLPGPKPDALFGHAVALDGELIVVGATHDDVGEAWDGGSAHVYRLIDGIWGYEQQFVAAVPQADANFGRDVNIHNGVVYVAAAFERFLTHAQGALYRFEHDGKEWVNTLRLVPSDAEPGGEAFGAAIDIEDDTLLVGAWRDDDNGTNAGAAYFYDLECGEFATLNSITVAFGQHLSGGLNRILESDDLYYRSRSNPGFTATEPNLIELRINATSTLTSANTLDLIIEGRISQPGGNARVRLRDWNAGPNHFETVHTYGLGLSEETEFIENVPDAERYIRASDGRMQLSLRHSVFATFSALGFESFLDFVSIEVEE